MYPRCERARLCGSNTISTTVCQGLANSECTSTAGQQWAHLNESVQAKNLHLALKKIQVTAGRNKKRPDKYQYL